jgi:YcxB-like protein
MTVAFEYDKSKVLQALRFHFINKKDIRLLLILVNVVAIISGTLFFLKKIPPTVFLMTSVMWIVLMILFWFLMPRMIYSRNRTFKDSFHVTVDGTSLNLQHKEGGRTWHYKDFINWFESPHFLHLYVGPNSFFIIPKYPFSNEQLQEVRDIFNTHIKK